jgi:hypothetical protein
MKRHNELARARRLSPAALRFVDAVVGSGQDTRAVVGGLRYLVAGLQEVIDETEHEQRRAAERRQQGGGTNASSD